MTGVHLLLSIEDCLYIFVHLELSIAWSEAKLGEATAIFQVTKHFET